MSSTLQNGDVIESLLDGGIIYAKINGVVVTSVANTTSVDLGTAWIRDVSPVAAGSTTGKRERSRSLPAHATRRRTAHPATTATPCTQLDVCKGGECVGDHPVVCALRISATAREPAIPHPESARIRRSRATTRTPAPRTAAIRRKGCVYKLPREQLRRRQPVHGRHVQPGGRCVHTGSDGPDNSCGKVTDSSLCALPTGLCGTSSSAPQFRLLELQDPTFSAIKGTTILNDYIINSSNPGQLYFNVFHAGTPGAAVDLTIDVPFPFVTQGAHPIQVYGSAGSSGGCFVPGTSLTGFTITTDGGNLSPPATPVILRSDYTVPNLGNATSVHVTGTVPATGLVYVTIHLDYGLKKVTGWQQASNGTTASGPRHESGQHARTDSAEVRSPSPARSPTDSVSAPVAARMPSRRRAATSSRRTPGSTGTRWRPPPETRCRASGCSSSVPRELSSRRRLSDLDGFFVFAYKHKGKTANYTVRLPITESRRR